MCSASKGGLQGPAQGGGGRVNLKIRGLGVDVSVFQVQPCITLTFALRLNESVCVRMSVVDYVCFQDVPPEESSKQ